jgi:hypothetical protein
MPRADFQIHINQIRVLLCFNLRVLDRKKEDAVA